MPSSASSLAGLLGMLAFVVCFALCWLGAKWVRTEIKRRSKARTTALATSRQTPLLPTDAEDGFQPCPSCGFENFMRAIFCTVCGSELHVPSCDEVGVTSFEVIIHMTKEQVEQMGSKSLTTRQQRARQRREWSRKLDLEGKLYWYHSVPEPVNKKATSITPSPLSQFPGYVVRFKLSVNYHYVGNHPETSSEPFTKEGRIQQLAGEVAAMQMTLLDVAKANPVVSSLCIIMSFQFAVEDLIEWSARDFPTKYAKFVSHTSTLLRHASGTVLRIYIHRRSLLRQSMEHLSEIPAAHMDSLLRIDFIGESGIDAGGLHREWFALLGNAIADPASGIFKCVNDRDRTLYLNDNSAHDIGDDHLMYFHSVGRFIGRALLEGATIGFHLATPLLKIILGLPLSFTDLEFFDPQAFKSMVWLLDHEDVDEALGLDFTVVVKRGENVMHVVDLVPDGRSLNVTDANKTHYLERKFQYLLLESVADQLYVFLKGIYEVVPHELLMMFDPEELDYVLCGSDEIDVDDWERSTKYSDSLANHSVKTWFWELVREMPNEYRRRLLQFATGSDRVPLSGFNSLTSSDDRISPFTLNGVPFKNGGNIWSHSCFNRLDVPLYESRKKLQLALFGVLDADFHGFTTV
uniref:HECT-type E3 ubiquitin transferase n=1 Tax=Globisporangium ultimum (strain ATCC 200006 / CBS 805.95 / DAOM BR144) TaxID=431595 RepID=K3X457_GLOUD